MEKRIDRMGARQFGMENWLNNALWLALFLLVIGSVLVVVNRGWSAETSDTDSKRAYHSGQVTAKRGNLIQINNQDYTMRSDVVIEDDEGRSREEKELKPGTEVNYYLKQGNIDKIVIRLPK